MNNEITRRIEKTPDRKIIYIDVGNMKSSDVEKYIESIKGKYTNKPQSRFKKTMSFLFGWLAYIDAPLFW